VLNEVAGLWRGLDLCTGKKRRRAADIQRETRCGVVMTISVAHPSRAKITPAMGSP
jgi:hypothetical protein